MNKFIKVRCHTNLDSHSKCLWPEWLYNPKIGDYVQSEGGKILRIVSITHLYDGTISDPTGSAFGIREPRPALLIELYN